VFPVAGPHSYSDTFGAPRMFGTSYAHLHQGTDIFASSGTPLVAVERGVVFSMGSDVLGGTKLWLQGASGTKYYYAHLSAFAEGMASGTVVSAGDVVGFVGNTGNAATTPAHCHFEVHPNGGPAVNPYPLLKIVDDAQKQILAGKPIATTTTQPKS
jgi:murein DD-endopeptidase MepM/ murein hydrolase activator NlpD